MKDNFEIIHEFYACIYAKDVERVQDLLKDNDWLKDVLQPSFLADMQFYKYDEDKRKYTPPYFPPKKLLYLLKDYGLDIEKSINTPIVYSADVILDNASYMSSSMQNKNAVKWEYENGITFQELVKQEGRSEYYSELFRNVPSKKDYDNAELTPLEIKRLQQLGNSWFVSYMYYLCIDNTHDNWTKTLNGFRKNYFKTTWPAHKKYLEKISNANEASLGTNKINLTGARIKEMAQELLEKWDEVSNRLAYVREIKKA